MTNTKLERKRQSASRTRIALLVVVGIVSCMVPGQFLQGQTFSDLYNFAGRPDGANPSAAPVMDSQGNLYGTTLTAGAYNYGTVFKLDSSGTETILHSFDDTDGSSPRGALIADTAGNFYGTTQQGGLAKDGTVFKVTSSGKLTVLHSFAGSDGCDPQGSLVRDARGNVYGTTSGCGASGYGTVFKLTPSGKLEVLHNFAGGKKDGISPFAGLIRDDKANLYGETTGGGASDYGVAFRLSARGKLTILHSFTGWITDGCYPAGNLAMDAQGNVYGTTTGCGSSGYGFGDGVVYRIDKRGTERVLYSFLGGTDGASPNAGVVLDSQGNLYGTTLYGGSTGWGTIFELDANGTETVLHSFAQETDGGEPYGGVLRDAAGALYGTAYYGGSSENGTVWELAP
jgi:uncharacterized repeat protein (TIGR03803 family)